MIAQSPEQHLHSEPLSEAAESSNKASLAKIVLLSLLAHICLVLALVRFDPLSFPASGSRQMRKHRTEQTPMVPPARARGQRNISQCGGQPLLLSMQTPHNFRSFAVPATAADGSETINYQFVVGGMLERVKQYPQSAVRRGAKGTVTIGFVLDESGGVASVSLLRSSGEADLDAESVALRRAAPFPPPPPGVKRSFAIEVAFGNKK